MAPKQILPKDMLAQRLPALLVSPNHTKSSALSGTKFVGPLDHWDTFQEDVFNVIKTAGWSRKVIGWGPRTGAVSDDKMPVGDEKSVLGRFQQSVGIVMAEVFKAQKTGMTLNDFQCTGRADPVHKTTPDIAMMHKNYVLKAVGEMKVP